jgi:phosphate/sulfate permease
MELSLIYTILGFGLAAWSVTANDSIQCLGTFIASKQKWFKWYTLAASASFAMIVTVSYGWWTHDGDISYGRLTQIPYQEIQWYHAVAPGILLLLTRIGIPVSTTFLVLSAFASTVVLEKMLLKSVVGYAVAAIVAYVCWIGISKLINEKFDEITTNWKIAFWRNSVWITTAFLWATWLMHDVANIAVYLPRKLDFSLLVIVLIYFTILLFYIFYIHGGPIQKVVLDKTGTRYARSATIINIIYALVLYYFKELNNLPMSTTWVFVGLLCGRELAISTMNKDYKLKYVFPLIGKDFVKMIFGLSVSIGIVLVIHYIIIPNDI